MSRLHDLKKGKLVKPKHSHTLEPPKEEESFEEIIERFEHDLKVKEAP